MNPTIQSFPIHAICCVPKLPVKGATVTSAQVVLQGQLAVYPDHVVLTVVDPIAGAIATQSIAIPQPPPGPSPESDADVLRRIAYDLEGPDWSECD